MKVLLVDDNPYFRKAAKRFLGEMEGVEAVATAENGLDAVDKALRERPDLVLMDLNMPGMSGFEAVRRIKAVHPDTRVIVVSLHDSGDFRAAAAEAGADGYIAKRDFATKLTSLLAALAEARGESGRSAGNLCWP